MSLGTLPTAAWDRIHPHLETRHVARLFATGDKLVQRGVIHGRRRNAFDNLEDTRLLVNTLIPTSVHADVHPSTLVPLSILDAATTTRLGSLRLTGALLHKFDKPINLTNLPNLTALQSCFSMDGQFTLPPSLTSLVLDGCPMTQVTNFNQLDNLAELQMKITLAELASFEKDYKWPPQLTALKAICDIRYRADAEAFQDALLLLPPTLVSLVLWHGCDDVEVFDIMPPTSCPNLESYAPLRLCTFRDQTRTFPASLKRLDVDWLPNSPQLLAALASSSLTHLRVHKTESGKDFVDTLLFMLPRLDLESVENALHHVFRSMSAYNKFPQPCIDAVKRVGLGVPYLQFIKSLYYAGIISSEDMAQLSGSSHVLDSVNRSDDVRRMLMQNCHTSEAIFKWSIEIGVFDSVEFTNLHALRICCLHANVKTLVINKVGAGVSMAAALKERDMSHIEKIVLKMEFVEWHRFVLSFFECRHLFTSLNEIHFQSWMGKDRFEDGDVALLRDARFYIKGPSSTDHVAKFHVTPPRWLKPTSSTTAK